MTSGALDDHVSRPQVDLALVELEIDFSVEDDAVVDRARGVHRGVLFFQRIARVEPGRGQLGPRMHLFARARRKHDHADDRATLGRFQ